MKITLYAAIAALLLAAVPAFAGEGNGEPFPYAAPAAAGAVTATLQPRDVGAAAYPDIAGLPGADLPRLAGAVLPTTGSAGAVQTANSLPAGFAEGTAVYVQAQQIERWVAAHSPAASSYVQARGAVRPNG